jgi:hypothetical protein
MALNLKQISYTDSDQIKLDKVNYNFDQLVTNGGGPQGPIGVTGNQGAQGTMGFQGPIGLTGAQGVQGPTGAAAGQYWYLIQEDSGIPGSVDTLIPKHETGENPPAVVIGYKSDAPEYQMPEGSSQLVIHRYDSESTSNLKLEANGVDSAFHFQLDNAGDLRMYFSDSDDIQGQLPPNSVVYETNSFNIKNSAQDDLLTVTPTGSTIFTDATFESDLNIEGKLTITTGNPDTDKIAVAKNTSGEIEFKSVQDLGGAVPVGTIISMIPSYFEDSSRFIQEQLNEGVDATTNLLHIKVGSGVGQYAGWYICNGKTWTDGTDTYETPDLCSFSYTIDDNAASQAGQGTAAVTNNATPLIGGADIDLTASYVTGSYNITGSVDTAFDTIQQSSGSSIVIRRLPQIIYLGVEDMYWTDAGSGQAPDTTMTLNFLDTKDGSDQDIVLTKSGGSSFTESIQLSAPTGYKWTNNISFTTTPAGFTINNMGIDSVDDTKLNILLSWTQPTVNTTYNFVYNSTGSTQLNTGTASYTIALTGDAIINDTAGAVTNQTLGQPQYLVRSTGNTFYTITMVSGYEYGSNSSLTVNTPGYNFVGSPVITPTTTINGQIQVDPFTVPAANNGAISITVVGEVDMSNVAVNLTGLSWFSSTFELSYNGNGGTTPVNSAMEYAIWGKVTTNANPTTFSAFDFVNTASYSSTSFQGTSSQPINNMGFLHVLIAPRKIISSGSINYATPPTIGDPLYGTGAQAVDSGFN